MKAEEALINEEKQVMRKVIKTVILEEISTGLTKENKVRIA